MKMKFFFPSITLFLFLSVTNTINARKDVGEYWPRGLMKDQSLPEATASSKTNCHTTNNSELKKVKSFVKDFKQPDISIYHNDAILEEKKLKSFVKDFKEPDVSIYHNDVILEEKKLKSFVKDFKEPDISIYHNDAILEEKKSFLKDFEPRPNISVYDDDVSLKEKKPFADDFEPRPNVSVYND
eukprot:XP_015574654.1 organ-specific protein S2-like [Ricinus communis]